MSGNYREDKKLFVGGVCEEWKVKRAYGCEDTRYRWEYGNKRERSSGRWREYLGKLFNVDGKENLMTDTRVYKSNDKCRKYKKVSDASKKPHLCS